MVQNKMTRLDVTGQKYSKLIAIRFAQIRNTNSYWLFKCDCGKEKEICLNNVRRGFTTNCGCSRKISKSRKHGFIQRHKKGKKNPRFYAIWSGMTNRCNNKNNSMYPLYGARGILVSEKWLKFENFMNDMYESYLKHVKEFSEKQTQIDRIDFKGNYCRENCRWVTIKEQARNRSTNTIFMINNKKMCISEIVEKYKIKNHTGVFRRLKKKIPIAEVIKELSR